MYNSLEEDHNRALDFIEANYNGFRKEYDNYRDGLRKVVVSAIQDTVDFLLWLEPRYACAVLDFFSRRRETDRGEPAGLRSASVFFEELRALTASKDPGKSLEDIEKARLIIQRAGMLDLHFANPGNSKFFQALETCNGM